MKNIFGLAAWIASSLLLVSCASTKQQSSTAQNIKQEYPNVGRLEGVSIETVQKEPKLPVRYDNLLLTPLQADPQTFTDYPSIATQLQSSVLSQLKGKNKYKVIDCIASKDAMASLNGNTLIVETKVTDMKIVSTGARIWVGAWAGSSYMDIYVKLTDAVTKRVVLEKIVSSSNNAFASAWAPGTEQSLPIDMGMIIGEYLAAIVPAN